MKNEILIKIKRPLGECCYCEGTGKRASAGPGEEDMCNPCKGSGEDWEDDEVSLKDLMEEEGIVCNK